jgi:hypothetical protein
MNRTSMIMVIVAAASILIASVDFSSSFAQGTGCQPAGCSDLKIVPLQYGDPSTDLPSCQQDCRSRYGIDRYTLQFGPGGRGGGGDTGAYYLYAQCIADCNKQFWNRFDKKMEEDR